MSSLGQVAESEEPPSLLTVTEAARLLRIGRTLAYQLATDYLRTGGMSGIPVIRVGRSSLRVPRWALLELVATGRVVRLRDEIDATSGASVAG